MAVNGYQVPAQDCRTEFIERKSRFITTIARVESVEEAEAFIQKIKKEFPDATHNCAAYRLKDPLVERFFDDGEPGGTAGMPMLDVLKKEELFDVAVVVTRYFGGILLGAGGLVRAYSKGAADGVRSAGKAMMERGVRLRVSCGYSFYDRFVRLCNEQQILVNKTDFAESILCEVLLKSTKEEDFTQQLLDASAGAVTVDRLEELFYPFSI